MLNDIQKNYLIAKTLFEEVNNKVMSDEVTPTGTGPEWGEWDKAWDQLASAENQLIAYCRRVSLNMTDNYDDHRALLQMFDRARREHKVRQRVLTLGMKLNSSTVH